MQLELTLILAVVILLAIEGGILQVFLGNLQSNRNQEGSDWNYLALEDQRRRRGRRRKEKTERNIIISSSKQI